MAACANPLLVVTEASDPRPVLARVLRVVRAANAELTLLDVIEPVPEESATLIPASALEALEAASLDRRRAMLDDLVERATRAGVPVRTTHSVGTPFYVAIRAALAGRHDLVVKSVDARAEHARSTLGSTDKHLLRKCPCPLWLLASESPGRARIAAAVDPDPLNPEAHALSTDILATAAAMASIENAPLDIVHAWRVFGEPLLRGPKPMIRDEEVDQILGDALNRHAGMLDDLIARAPLGGLTTRTHLAHARASDAIIDFVGSHPVGLLVMGTVGRSGIPGFLISNTAEQVLSEVTCSVLALKPRGFVSPIPASS